MGDCQCRGAWQHQPHHCSGGRGGTASFTVTPGRRLQIQERDGIGTFNGSTYTTGPVTGACTVSASFHPLPGTPALSLKPTAIKTFRFAWSDVKWETEYRLLEDPDGVTDYTQVATLAVGSTGYDHEVFLPGRPNARFILAGMQQSRLQ